MGKENLTPAQSVEADTIGYLEPGTPEWLFSFMPDFEERWRKWKESGFDGSFSKQYFREAIVAFEDSIRLEAVSEITERMSDHGIDMNSKWARRLWQQACEAQRAECVSHFSKICKDSYYDAAVIHNAPIPEIPKELEQ